MRVNRLLRNGITAFQEKCPPLPSSHRGARGAVQTIDLKSCFFFKKGLRTPAAKKNDVVNNEMSRWWYEDGEEEDEAAGMVMNKRPVFSFYIRAATSKTLRELCLKTNDGTRPASRRGETPFTNVLI